MAEQLKNVYNKEYIKNLATKIKENHKSFDTNGFINAIFDSTWQTLELKARMRHIALQLNAFLPLPYKEQLKILKMVSKDFFSFEAMFFQDFVEVFGLEDFENSIKALEVFTLESSSEFAIRAFILKYEDQTMQQMKLWAQSSNEHIRRLACEGCRPRLPWAVALPNFKKNPQKVFEIIELLKNDSSKYVQKSVANSLNDISKDNPKMVVEFVRKNLNISKNLDWICKHGSRTLLKKGDKEVLNLFNFDKSHHINLTNFCCDKNIFLNEDFNFSFEINSDEPIGNIRVEYVIYYLKSNSNHNKKVFMISQNSIESTKKRFQKKQSFKNMTTRKHYIGTHFIGILINGVEVLKEEFFLHDPSN
ncbi:DNA alkylation repair protein [Aliarcobacter skirrowii]|uniref:DNA alkylation repair protein n=1 Tax=Aliarcobacter skirrowii TaxID=28200 RepID=UPI0029A17198|nr:DNA alkylation repair protein [Aliarcobacter skirrowii]MDX4058786.1 DNA alkylation repair protein [Aliarcobacter skirrowii]